MAPMLERLQPMDSSMGLRKTAREKSVPMDMVMMTKAAPAHPAVEESLRHEVAIALSRTGMSKSSATTMPAASVPHAKP